MHGKYSTNGFCRNYSTRVISAGLRLPADYTKNEICSLPLLLGMYLLPWVQVMLTSATLIWVCHFSFHLVVEVKWLCCPEAVAAFLGEGLQHVPGPGHPRTRCRSPHHHLYPWGLFHRGCQCGHPECPEQKGPRRENRRAATKQSWEVHWCVPWPPQPTAKPREIQPDPPRIQCSTQSSGGLWAQHYYKPEI